jgi:uncharacterized protein YjiS (DUF1127 family)
MSVQTSEPAMAFQGSEKQSFYPAWDNADQSPVLPPRRRGPVDRFVSAVRDWLHRMGVRQELYSMADRELADMGINRYDIGRIFDPEFAREHSGRR